MTLSILWRSEGRLHLASDSRISFRGAGSADVGVKVMRLPIRVLGTDIDDGGGPRVLFEQTYGFCYAGSLANAATFKEFIGDLLIGVQYLPADEPLSFEKLCNFLCRFCGRISTEIVSRLAENGQYTFFIAGLCPQTTRLRGARFHLEQNAGETLVTFEEVARDEGEYVAVGSGEREFEALFAGQFATMCKVLLTLNQVIDEGKVDSVGGDIQYGSFGKDGNFSVSGLVRISVEDVIDEDKLYGPSEQRVWKYRGFDLYADWENLDEKFWPSPMFIKLEVPSNKESEQRFIDQCRKQISGS
ncbi:hypothetical protein [Burkholderia pyrrocinia]|uniref:hypothetical protein n=1 Tax=Burkholderia pyrrocinia TaxID=60550 RepID=UPI00158ECFCC|nr:hypothetical protein [Burkholderia pyrrocinia]